MEIVISYLEMNDRYDISIISIIFFCTTNELLFFAIITYGKYLLHKSNFNDTENKTEND